MEVHRKSEQEVVEQVDDHDEAVVQKQDCKVEAEYQGCNDLELLIQMVPGRGKRKLSVQKEQIEDLPSNLVR